MMKSDEKWLKALMILAIIATLFGIACKAVPESLNGECIEVEAVEQEVETPIALTATPIVDKPIYVQWLPMDCIEDLEDETFYPTRDEVYCIARIIHGEASVCSDEVKACTAYVVLNRVDAPNYPDTIREVCEQEGQFAGWLRECSSKPTEAEREMAYEIIKAWKNCDDRYRPIPSDYLYFRGNGTTNYFTTYFCKSLSEAKRNAYDFRMPNLWKGEEE